MPVMILTVGRSGSSLVAGILHKLGVNMGRSTVHSPDQHNELGYYEDDEFHNNNERLVKKLKSFDLSFHEIKDFTSDIHTRDLIKKRCSEHTQWGFKSAKTIYTIPFYLRWAKWNIIVVHRKLDSVALSISKKTKRSFSKSLFSVVQNNKQLMGAVDFALRSGQACVMGVNYDWVLNNPELAVERIRRFIGAKNTSVKDAVAFVHPELNHGN